MSRLDDSLSKMVNFELLICKDVLKLNSLHYGFWHKKNKRNVDLADVRRAQSEYTETLIDLIPDNVNSILDVGCGTGDIAIALAKKGYRVTALSPDEDLFSFFHGSETVEYHSVKFEDFVQAKKCDLILMSESQNYFDMDVGFRQSRRYLNTGGYLLVSGIFRQTNSKEFDNIPCIENDYIQTAESYNFTLIRSLDITTNVLPTVEYAHKNYIDHIVPSINVINKLFLNMAPVKLRLLKLIFRKESRRLHMLKTYYAQRVDPILFERYVKYLRLLFRLQGDTLGADGRNRMAFT